MLMFAFLLSSAAVAGEDDRARELFINGRDLYDSGRYEDAIIAWRAAYDLSDKPLLLYNLSNAYERSGQYELALDALGKYRAFSSTDERDTIDARLRNLEERAAIEREKKAKLEEERRLREAELAAERRRAEEAEQSAARGGHAPILPIAVTAVGLGLVGVGIVSGLQVSSARKVLADPANCGPSGICKQAAADANTRQRQGALITDLTLGGGLVVTAVGAVLFVGHLTSGRKDPNQISMWAAPTASGASMGVFGAF